MNKYLIISILGMFFISCSQKQKTENIPTQNTETHTLQKSNKIESFPIELFVIDREGVDLKEKPDEKSKTLKKAYYAEAFEVKNKVGDWYLVNAYIVESEIINGKEMESMGYKNAYVKKGKLGLPKNISLNESDLYVMNDYGNKEFKEKNKKAKESLKIKLISEKEYLEAKKKAVNFFKWDTLSVKKNNGAFSLKSENSKVEKFIDKDTDLEDKTFYQYVGEIPVLGKSVIEGSYYEIYNYILWDKKTGKKQEFSEFPYLSPDKKHIFSVYFDPYSTITFLNVYAVDKNNQSTPILEEIEFEIWFGQNDLKENNENRIFFSADGYFYMPVIHKSLINFVYNGKNDFKYWQYIKIKIK